MKDNTVENKRINYGIAKVMLGYWIMVILWQTFRPVANRSLVDALVKVALFGIVLFYGINHRKKLHVSYISVPFHFFLITQIITLIGDSVTVGVAITCAFMIVQIVVYLIWLQNEEISIKGLEWFAKSVIIIAVAMGLYSVIFESDRFINAYTSVGAYGSECNSFLYSNHEYALYLASALLFAVWLQLSKQIGWTKFILLIGFLAINLVSTFSRTAILGCIIALCMLAFAAGRVYFIRIAAAGVGIFSISMASGKVRDFILGKILKGSIEKSGSIVDDGRAAMYEYEWWYFKDGSLLEKLFGHGYVGNQAGGHNAYLMILNTGGIIMFLFYLALIIHCLKKSLTCMHIDKMIGSLCIGMQVLVLLYMMAQTPILFYSTMDSFFITTLFVMIPLYTTNFMTNRACREMGI